MAALEQQGLIQAFVFTHELSWLLLKDFSSHNYNSTLVEEIAQLIATQYSKELQGLQRELRRRAEQSR